MKAWGVMSLKLHFMDSRFNFPPENMCDVSDEHGKQFHQKSLIWKVIIKENLYLHDLLTTAGV